MRETKKARPVIQAMLDEMYVALGPQGGQTVPSNSPTGVTPEALSSSTPSGSSAAPSDAKATTPSAQKEGEHMRMPMMTEREAQERMAALARRRYKERSEAAQRKPILADFPDEEAWEEALAGWMRRMRRQAPRTSKD